MPPKCLSSRLVRPMSDRLIRDELLDSARWIALRPRKATPQQVATANAARCCFIALTLTADDYGNLEASEVRLERLWHDFLLDSSDPEELGAITKSLAAAGLIHQYVADGKSFIHIPRFRQRLRTQKAKHPMPQFQIKELQDYCPTADQQSADNSMPSVKQLRKKEGSEGREGKERAPVRATHPVDKSTNGKHRTPGWWKTTKGIEDKGVEIGVNARTGESMESYRQRIFDTINHGKTKAATAS